MDPVPRRPSGMPAEGGQHFLAETASSRALMLSTSPWTAVATAPIVAADGVAAADCTLVSTCLAAAVTLSTSPPNSESRRT